MSIEAMKQALEALESFAPHNGVFWRNLHKEDAEIAEAITSLCQAISEAEKQVVFKIYKPTPPRGAIPNVRDAELPWVYDQDPSSGNVASMWVTPVKVTPQPQQEPVAWMCSDESLVHKGYSRFSKNCEGAWNIPVYTTAQRQWVGLTDEDVYPLANEHLHYQLESYEVSGIYDLARAIEAKLKEKNQ